MSLDHRVEEAAEILEHLVGFRTISGTTNLDFVDYVKTFLEGHGLDVSLSYSDDGQRANVLATVGPATGAGVLLNGHTDVVPVEGQVWSTDPFRLTRSGDRLHGRGSVDMKGFLACVLASVPMFRETALARPVHIAFSYDEEIGGFGMPGLLADMAGKGIRPHAVIVGEPTEMQIVSGHKGGYDLGFDVTGLETHACNPALGVNAINYAARMIAHIDSISEELAANPYADSPFEPPHCTFNVGLIQGGTARNATAGYCHFDCEFRPLPGEDGAAIVGRITGYARDVLVPEMRRTGPDCDIAITVDGPIPALDNTRAGNAVTLIGELTGLNSENVVSFGTDGGYFSDAGHSAAVFGPGTIRRAHKPDEYITTGEIAEGLAFLEKLAHRLTRP